MINKLDINLQKNISTVQYEAFPLYAILANPNLYDWFLNHYVDLYQIVAHKSQKFTFHNIRYAENQPYLHYGRNREVLTFNQIESKRIVSKINIIDFIRENIDNGNYMIAMLNEYFIPVNGVYIRNHSYHDFFVYGYDDDKSILFSITFFEGAYILFEISYSDFEEGFLAICEDESEIGLSNRFIYLFQCKSNISYDFNLDMFADQLENFINRKLDKALLYNLDLINLSTPREDWEYYFGFEIYEEYTKILRAEYVEYSPIDYRNVHILCEHKSLMLNRLKYLSDNKKLSGLEDIICKYEMLEENFILLRNLALKYNLLCRTRSVSPEHIKKVFDRIPEIIESNQPKEEALYRQIIEYIHMT